MTSTKCGLTVHTFKWKISEIAMEGIANLAKSLFVYMGIIYRFHIFGCRTRAHRLVASPV